MAVFLITRLKSGKIKRQELGKHKQIKQELTQKEFVLEATHQGYFQDNPSNQAPDCYVLNNVARTAVLSQRGLANLLGIKNTSGRAVIRFFNTKQMQLEGGVEIQRRLAQPLVFRAPVPGRSRERTCIMHGYSTEVVIDLCVFILRSPLVHSSAPFAQKVVKRVISLMVASSKSPGNLAPLQTILDTVY